MYIAAFMPDAGEVLGELAGRFPGSQLEAALTPVAVPGPDDSPAADLYIRSDRFREVFAQDVPTSDTRILAVAQRPLTAAAFTDRCTAAAWRTLPSWALISGKDRGIVPELQRFQARRADPAPPRSLPPTCPCTAGPMPSCRSSGRRPDRLTPRSSRSHPTEETA